MALLPLLLLPRLASLRERLLLGRDTFRRRFGFSDADLAELLLVGSTFLRGPPFSVGVGLLLAGGWAAFAWHCTTPTAKAPGTSVGAADAADTSGGGAAGSFSAATAGGSPSKLFGVSKAATAEKSFAAISLPSLCTVGGSFVCGHPGQTQPRSVQMTPGTSFAC